ncbi:alpha/beta-hydrolase [Dacryopinax primogenitus]|uniref:Alpha/beta-hydrolase n=1 Tax=Dacryopinax primogenitus (strain DJM 731) TaxID=1858805 RepID=M5GAZ5_DACPD|nr:alpha/beta-hydrolase [Dacryopinax primogenitus]EJU03157.1 alpha/beta-hydrolase [Dacryopinax primogenitus]
MSPPMALLSPLTVPPTSLSQMHSRPPPGPPSPGKQRPTIVLVPGAWHTSLVWASLISLLSAAGYPCVTLDLPSVGGRVTSMQEDTDAVHVLLSRLVRAGKDVVVVMHSYGGLPGAAAVKGLGKVDQRQGGVIQLVFLGSFLLDKGIAALDLLKGTLPYWVELIDGGTFLRCTCPEDVWYQDLSPEEQSRWAALLKPQCTVTFTSPVLHPGWKEIPSTYLITQQDKAVPPWIQEEMVVSARRAMTTCKCSNPVCNPGSHSSPGIAFSGRGGMIRIERSDSGHAVMLSHPEEVCRVIRRAAGEEV